MSTINTTFVACEHCGAEGDIELGSGPLACSCGHILNRISVVPWASAIEQIVRANAAKQAAGTMGTRKQSSKSDTDIDRDGLQGELAACLILCPQHRDEWFATRGPNRGNDLPPEWTGLPKPLEVKQTRWHDERRGYLLVRPPRWTRGWWS